MHPTSLPGRFGIGDIGLQSYRFIDFLAEANQQLWQILPLGPTGHGNSPYMSYSSMAGNPLLISLETIQAHGLLDPEDLLIESPFPNERVDFDRVIPFKLGRLRKAAERFKDRADSETQTAFSQFCEARSVWLEDYALFMAIKGEQNGASWSQWESAIARREPDALDRKRVELAPEIFYHKYMQFEFCRQWFDLKRYANQNGIQIVGDMPIYVAHDSVDVWAFPENFMLDPDTLKPSTMAGVPPDYFSETGQLWGNPTYNWEELQKTEFSWWLQRIQAQLDYNDLIRIDHFRGFESYWAVPGDQDTAIHGEWVEAPGYAFFETVEAKLGKLPFLAEDLGTITPEVGALRDRFEFPGMKILQFAFGSDHRNPYLPYNVGENFLIYTGTHDNDTTVGWFQNGTDYEKERLSSYIGAFNPETVHWSMIRLALGSVAKQAVIPLQDLLGRDSESRMNTPGKAEGNWEWRFEESVLTHKIREQLSYLTDLYGRAPGQWDEPQD